ncbi:hypothetical protein GCM10009665_67950 [Kitasatospora nipponensis]|uniref:Glycoside-hydrolase family GH114 TIM-barrel domain-containing protein n=1 Tax=Kitasatospora nipponensis TaxID=258049 RepID=A0ABP4HLU0_9ACTN
MTRRTAVLLAALTLSTTLLATACGSSGDSDSDQLDPAPAASDSATPGTDSPTPSASDSASASASPSATAGSSAPGSPDGSPKAPGSAPATTGGGPGTTAPGTTTPTGSAPVTGAYWHPTPGQAWQWQLSGTVDQSVNAPVYDIDGFENDASVVAALHAKGRKVVCYINAGSWEDFRPDAAAFPASVRGSGNGWKGEKWFDIRQVDVLRPLLGKRFDMCKEKGFDAVEPDLMDAYANNSGFPVTADQQLTYNRMIAQLAHERGMGVALKNDLDQIPALVGDFDFAVNEQCAEYQECDKLTPFIKAGKAVLHVEYSVPTNQFCAQSNQLDLSSMEKHLELDAWRQTC